jgi:hypothetical protein
MFMSRWLKLPEGAGPDAFPSAERLRKTRHLDVAESVGDLGDR